MFFYREFNSYPNPIIDYLMQQNLCSYFKNEYDSSIPCESFSAGVARYGLTGVTTAITSGLVQSKSFYDSLPNPKSQNDIKTTLDNILVKDMETITEFLLWLPFEAIQTEMYDEMISQVNYFLQTLWITNVVFIIMSAGMGVISYKLIYQQALHERYYLQRMLQQMPLRYILGNAHLKPFLPKKLLVL
jgi:hypothetical protein